MELFTKTQIARARSVTERTVDNWVDKELLSPPIKLGTKQQSRVRWTKDSVDALDRKLAALTVIRERAS